MDIFCLRFCDDYLRGKNHSDDLITLLMDSLKKGDESEQLNALKLLSMVIISLQDDHSKIITWIKNILIMIIEKTTFLNVQQEAMTVYSTLIFFCRK